MSRPVSRIAVTVTPAARETRIVGRHGAGWKLRVSEPAERGQANKAVIDLICDALALSRDDVAVVGGHASRQKVVRVTGLSAEEIEARLLARTGA